MIRILAEPRLGLIVSEHPSASWIARAEDSALRATDIHEFRKTYAIQLPWLLRLLCWDNYLSSFADRFLVGVKEVKILHREGWAGAGESPTICEFLKE